MPVMPAVSVPRVPLPPVVPPPGLVAQPQPAAQAPQPLPPPNPLPFGDDRIRLPRLAQPPGVLGATPVPTPKDLEHYRQFVEGVIDPRNTLDLIEGRARLILLKVTPTRTQIADEAIANFRVLEPRGTQMTIIGRKVGTTVLNLWFPDPANKDKEQVLSYLIRVLPDPELRARLEAIYKALEIEINKAFPQSRVRLALVGDKLMVSGQAHDVYEATQILRILNANAPGNQNQNQNQGQGGQAAGPANRPPIATLIPTGNPFDPLRPIQTPGLESYETAAGQSVINNLRVPGEQQISLKVVVAEVNRAAARTIGMNWHVTNQNGIQVFAQNTGQLGTAGATAGTTGVNGQSVGSGIGTGQINLPITLDNGRIPIALQALRTLSYARSLAEPTLTTMNGQMAMFLAGGQFPVPVIGGFGSFGAGGGGLQGVQFVPFGVQLMFTPTLTDRDRIRLTVMSTVSTRNPAAGTNIGGSNVSGLNARTFMTTVELREGQTLAVAGLIQNDIGANAARVPFFGDLPIIGRAFSLEQTSHGEEELVVLITPQLVHPMEPKEIPPLPGCDVFEPGDLEFYLLGRLESRRSYDYRSAVRTDIHRMLRYRHCEDTYIIGPTGHANVPGVVPAGYK